MKKTGWLWVSIGVVIGISLVAAVWATLSFSGSGRICNGVTIEGVNVGGLSRNSCIEVTSIWAQAHSKRRIVLTALDSRWIGALPDFGARLDWPTAVDNAYSVGRSGNFINRMICVLTEKGGNKHIRIHIAVDSGMVSKTVSKVARSINRPHRDARLRDNGGRLEVTQDACGIKLDKDAAVKVIENAIKSGKILASLPIQSDKPDVDLESASGIDTLLARFTTRFNPGKRNRTHNLILAAKAINGVIVPGGRPFSYNDSVGPRIEARGFLEAPIFVKGKMEPGVGGGICQVSSTLYNAVLLTGLTVKERYPHSRTVAYTTPGRDATVAFGIRDFSFTNPMGTAVGILTHMGRSSLTVDIYGAASDKKDITVFTGPVAYTPIPGSIIQLDPTLPAGTRRITDKGSRGARVTVYRKFNLPDGTAKTEKVSTDRYPAQKQIVGIGPKAKPAIAS